MQQVPGVGADGELPWGPYLPIRFRSAEDLIARYDADPMSMTFDQGEAIRPGEADGQSTIEN